MQRSLPGIALVLFLLAVVGVGPVAYVTWRDSRWMQPAVPTPLPRAPLREALLYTYIVDVEGWYRTTPHERAVASPYDLAWERVAELPLALGECQGSEVPVGPEIMEWFESPDVSVRRLYSNGQGQQVWLSLFGSRGRKSYSLFEHTPATSYPAAGWTLLDNRVESVPLRGGAMYVQKAVLEKDGERRVVYYWYLWGDARRDPEKGVLTVRLHAVARGDEAVALAVANSFLRILFPETLPWQRF